MYGILAILAIIALIAIECHLGSIAKSLKSIDDILYEIRKRMKDA